MRGFIIVVILVVLGYAGTQTLTAFKVKGDLTTKVQHYLDLVDAKSIESVKRDLTKDAKELGVTLAPENIVIGYEDTDVQSLAQKMVGGKLGAQFQNKKVTIVVRYTARIALVSVGQQITEMKYVQVAAPVIPPTKAAQELLDSN